MSESDSRDIVGDAVDAVTLNQDVQWERCAKRATPAERRALDKLRRWAAILEDSPARAGMAATRDEPNVAWHGSAWVRRVLRAVVTIAVVEVAAALLLLPWGWEAYRREHGDSALFMAGLLIGHAASACLLLSVGGRDRRTRLLGVFFLLKATVAPLHILPAILWGMPPPDLLHIVPSGLPTPTRAFFYLYAYPFAFAPAVLWVFARECPRVHRRTRLDDLAYRMVPIGMALPFALWLGAAAIELSRTASPALFTAMLNAAMVLLDLLALAAVAVVVLRARTASAEEKRRVVLFSVAFLAWLGWVTTEDLVQVFRPGHLLTSFQWTSAGVALQLLRFPVMVVLWYSVLAARVPHPRELIRSGYRRLLLRPGLLGVAAAAPLSVLGWLLVSRPEREVGSVVADPVVRSLLATAGTMLLVVLGRERLLRRLDAWIDPETVDQRAVLAAATVALAKAERMTTIGRTVTRSVKRGCGSPSTLAVADNGQAGAGDFRAPNPAIAPLPRTSAIVHLLEAGGGALRVHPGDATSVFELLPPDEAAWVAETAADVVVPVPGPGTRVVGLVLVGRRFDDRLVRDADVPFLEVLAAAAGQAITRLQLLGGTEKDAVPALECAVCGQVSGRDEPPACECGGTHVDAGVPRLLAGKYSLTRRLGGGGTAAVYLAWDLSLQRDVAVKALTNLAELRPALASEAWAMARVAHPSLAEIHGVESWQGRPFLIVEFLRGGTLADRLGNGTVPGPEAVSIAARLAEALAALHEAGYLHGDVKPTNIGFTANGLPKLLDFGLARGPHDARVAGGTLRYLSPEVLAGQPATEADDVWSLCVVLYEMVVGEHPFAGDGGDEVADRIREQRSSGGGRPTAVWATAGPVAAFAASVLAAPRSARPTTARALANRLGEVAST